ncbi:protein FAM3B-like [Osmerus eperlanus]|uniref:protein FAM3B-like n=1 Tax=Osmerus eperlanus TaxID=29151 RepID=UPI002E11D38D
MAACTSRHLWYFLRTAGFLFCCVFAWYFGRSAFDFGCEWSNNRFISASVARLHRETRPQQKPAGVPVPGRQKCNRWSKCPPGKFAFQILSGGGIQKQPKICFENAMIIDGHNAGRGINIAAVDASSGEKIDSASFNMWQGDNSVALINFLHKISNGSFILMATYDEGSTKLKPEAKKEIESLGSTIIGKIGFRSSWVFLGSKGFTIPEDINKEKILYSNSKTNRYKGWPAEVQIDGCVGHI